MVFGIFYYLINGIAWYCFVLYCVVGFGARAVSRKTPIYFMLCYFRTGNIHIGTDPKYLFRESFVKSSVKLPLLVTARLIALVPPNIGACLATVWTTPDKNQIRKLSKLIFFKIKENNP